jgi:phosphatidylinositol alpha-1,6-mannosyltransferase
VAAVPHALLLTTDFRPMRGGIAEYLHGLWDHIARVVPATVVTTVPTGAVPWDHAYRLRVLPDPVALARGPAARSDRDISPAYRVFLMRRHGAEATLPYVREAGAGAVAAFVGVWNVLSHSWCRALAGAGVPYSLFAHDAELTDRQMYASVDGWRDADVRGARAVYATSTDTASRLAERYGAAVDVRVVSPGVTEPADPVACARRAGELARELELGGGKLVLLTVARLERTKGVDLVLESLGALAPSVPGLRYVVVGDGAERGRLQAQARALGIERLVTFTGPVDETSKLALYSLCDVFVMPSRLVPGRPWEGFGIALLEAGMFGKPVVGGRVGGTADAVDDEVTGLLVDTADGRGTHEALSRLVGDEGLRARLGAAGQRRVRARALWPHVARRFLQETGLTVPS